jgi:hypothetical protein
MGGVLTKNNSNKVVGAWLIIEIAEQRIVSEHLALISGQITQSNFLESQEGLQMPALTAGLKGVEDGDELKMVYFTTRGELDRFISGNAPGFTDSGLRYFKRTSDGWNLIHEDFESKP